MNRRKFLKSGLILVPAFPAIVKAQSEDWFRIASEGNAASGGGSYHLTETFGASPNDNNNASSGDIAAYSWTAASSYSLARVDLGLIKQGAQAGVIIAQIWSNNATGPKPNAKLGSDSASIAGSTIVSTDQTNPTYGQFTFASSISIVSGTKYWAVPVAAAGDAYSYVCSGGSGDYATSANSGSTWASICAACLQGSIKTYTFS